MANTFLLIAILIVLVVLYFLFNNYRKTMSDPHHDHHEVADGGVCCGRHTVCDKGYDNSDLYFDDEELDAYKGKEPGEYTDEEIEEFRNVLYTMRTEEVDTWVKCLQTRGIEIPAVIKEEILLMLQ